MDLVARLRKEITAIEHRIERKKGEIDRLAQQRHDIAGTIGYLMESQRAAQPELPMAQRLSFEEHVTMARQSGRSISTTLVEFARHSGGILYTQRAKEVLVAAGLIDNSRNGSRRIWRAVHRLTNERGVLARIARGQYQLLEAPPTDTTFPANKPRVGQ